MAEHAGTRGFGFAPMTYRESRATRGARPLRRGLEERELARPLAKAALLVGSVFVIGVVGYAVIGYPRYGWVDAVYMTVITLTTVGYAEIIDLTLDPVGRAFTILLLIGGVGSFIYFVSNLTAFLVEGKIQLLLWRKRMTKAIGKLSQHTVVCGGGHTGQHIVKELLLTERPFVLIEAEQQRVADLIELSGTEFPTVIGDATDDETLLAAGIERAQGLVATVSNDKDNLLIVVSARILNPSLRIVCRCIDERVEGKIHKAGADAVVSPNRIGGLRMISEVVRPTAVSFLDSMLRDEDKRLRVEGMEIAAGSSLDGCTLADIKKRPIRDLLIVALRTKEDRWLYNPPDESRLAAGMSVIYMGSPEGRKSMEHVLRG